MKRMIVGVLVSGVIVSVVLLGLGYRMSQGQETKPSQTNDLVSQTDELYKQYLRGNVAQARESLEKDIRLVEKAPGLRPDAQAHGLWLSYARLYVLEKKAGDQMLAEVDLIKARYWLLRRQELRGDAKEEVAEYIVKTMPPEKIQELVEHWDERFSDGKGPNYTRQK